MPSAPLLNGIDQLLRPYGGSGEYRYSQRETQSLQTGEPENWDHFFQAVRERLKIGSLFKNVIAVGSFGLAGDFLSLVGWRISRGQGRALSFLLPVLTEEIGTGALTTFNREGGWSWENLKTEWLEGGIHRAILQTSTLFFFGIANPTPLSIFKKPLKTGGKTWGIAVGRFLAMGALLMLGGMAARFTSHKINNRTPNPFSEDRTVQGIFLEYLDTAWMVGQGRVRTKTLNLESRYRQSITDQLWEEGIDTSFLEKPLPADHREQIRHRALELNPGYSDPQKLLTMVTWDTTQYHREHLPSRVGTLQDKRRFSHQRELRVLDMAIRMPGKGWAIPRAFAQYQEVIQRAVEHERAINPDFDDSYYVYFTVDQKTVQPGKAQRRVGWHGDAFVSPETSDLTRRVICDNTYVVCDDLPTLFLPGPFPLDGVDATNFRAVLKQFDRLADGKTPLTYKPYELLRMTPYDIHTPDTNRTNRPIVRTFVKIQFSRDKLNRIGNGINRVVGKEGKPIFDYEGWTWVARDAEGRNNRNSIIGWDREDRDRFLRIEPSAIDFSAEKPNADWLDSEFFWGKKIEPVRAERAKTGEMLETISQNGKFRSTFNIANEGDWKITTSQGDKYFLSDTKFRARYYVEDGLREAIYRPRSTATKMVKITKPIRYRSPWGAWAYAPTGSVLVSLGNNDVYAILPENFKSAYIRTNEQGQILPVGMSEPEANDVITRRGLVRVREEVPSIQQPVIAIFDLHGTLAKPNWKKAMGRVCQRLDERLDDEAVTHLMEGITYGATDSEVLQRVAALKAGTTVDEVQKLFQEERRNVGLHSPLEALPGAVEFLQALHAKGVPMVAGTFAHTPRKRTVDQLAESGILRLFQEEDILTKESFQGTLDRHRFREAVVERVRKKYPGAQILFFNDTPDGMMSVSEAGGINFGIPQGRGKDWDYRSYPLVTSGAHYLLHDWTVNGPEILKLIDQSYSI